MADCIPSIEPVNESARSALERALRAAIRGEVRFDRLSRTIYSTDASLYEIVPAGVVLPRDVDDVVNVVRVCGEHRVPLVPRGAGTGIAGGAVGWGVQVDFSRYMNRIGPIDVERRTVAVGPGVVLDDLNAAAGRHGLQFAPDVAPSNRATLGGMIANNSCGSHSVLYGRTADHIAALTVVLADGSVATWPHLPFADLPGAAARADVEADGRVDLQRDGAGGQRAGAISAALERIAREYRADVLARYPRVLRRNGGYALDRLCMSGAPNPATVVIGSEGTLALVVEAVLRLTPLPRFKALLVSHFDSVLDAIGATPRVLRHRPAAVELVDHIILAAGSLQMPAATRDAFLVGAPAAILVTELFDDDEGALRDRLAELDADLRGAGIGQPARQITEPAVQQAVWALRNKGFGLLTSRPGPRQPHEFIEDAAVEPGRLRDYIAELDAMLAAEGVSEVAHYAHASVGVIHVRPSLNLHEPADVARMRRIAEKTTGLVLKYGGAMTGEHGDGIVRSEWLERMYGPRIVAAFGEIKRAFDPDNLFNPRKIVDPLPMDERLRYRPRAAGSHPAGAPGGPSRPLRLHFDYGGHGDMGGLAGMCSGVGQCRQKLVGTMCPSYMATLDEQHTTRARANALRAALDGGGLIRGLDDPALDDVMDLCLSCKACKTECPTGVDMAKLKAEWLAHRNAARGVPRSARFLANAARWAALGSAWPWLANAVGQSRWVRAALERRFGLDRRVPPPRFASRTFRRWFESRRRPPRRGARGRVIYFVDTWMDAYWPEVGIASVRLLEAAGFEVLVPRLACCGRPLISKGLLGEAAALLRANVEALEGAARGGAWIAGSEPSCILTLADEGPQLVGTEAARRVAGRVRTVEALLSEVLREDRGAIVFRGVGDERIVFHGHCHQKALVGTSAALELLRAAPGVEAGEINSGCCGMAGSFGHEAAHYEVARAVGEQRLFPAIRARGDATVAVCGFSCREQIGHHTGVRALHVLELAAMRLDDR